MRILLIAYEFPPSPSPQSLRWAYLTGRLADQGHEVHVMAPMLAGAADGLPMLPASVRVHRVFPGVVRAALAHLARRRPLARTTADGSTSDAGREAPVLAPPVLNWKGRLLERIQSLLSTMVFPDLRGEWKRPALRVLPSLLERCSPQVVISSHEPATTLELGLRARQLGYPWVADLGDPVLAVYTPVRWRSRAARLESQVVEVADHVLVTTDRAAVLLQARHGGSAPMTVVPQGFDESIAGATRSAEPAGSVTRLLYGGSFYPFRDPAPLVEAVLEVPGVRLEIASGSVPRTVLDAAVRHPDQIRLLGRLPHRDLLLLQRRVDVLVNIANEDPTQVPGKVYEYLGAGRPVLHVGGGNDAIGALLTGLSRGWTCSGDRGSIADLLRELRARHEVGRLDAGLCLDAGVVAPWSWTRAASTVEHVLESVVATRPGARSE